MPLLKKIFFKTSGLIPSKFITTLSDINVLLPYHHVVSDEYLPHISGLYKYKNQAQFIKDLDWLLKFRSPIHPEELLQAVTLNHEIKAKTFLLTFDDGFREIYDIVAPILLKKGVPAIFFINPSFIDNKELFYRCKLSLIIEKMKQDRALQKLITKELNLNGLSAPSLIRAELLKINYLNKDKAETLGQLSGISFKDYLYEKRPFLTKDQVYKLKKDGFTIGSHSIDHPLYSLLNEEEQIRQTVESINYVNTLTESKSYFFSFPHEDRLIKKTFFKKLFDQKDKSQLLLFGVQNQLREGNNMLHRFNAENPFIKIEESAKSIMTYNWLLSVINKNNVVRTT
ncbi:MAG: polysaccharide deacetylase family protein [Bacteroidetes bacterium]|nr:polysaccharide deacetylase family protein [Bacteroidota bacterium]